MINVSKWKTAIFTFVQNDFLQLFRNELLLNCIYPKIFSIIQNCQLSNILTNTISREQRFVIGEIDKTPDNNGKSS